METLEQVGTLKQSKRDLLVTMGPLKLAGPRGGGGPQSQLGSFGYHNALEVTWDSRSRAIGARSKQALQIKRF